MSAELTAWLLLNNFAKRCQLFLGITLKNVGSQVEENCSEKGKNNINSLFLLVEKRKAFQLKASNLQKKEISTERENLLF